MPPDEVKRVGEQKPVEFGKLERPPKVGGVEPYLRTRSGRRTDFLQGAGVPVNGDNFALQTEQLTHRAGKHAATGPEVGPGFAGRGNTGLNERKGVGVLHVLSVRFKPIAQLGA